MVTSMRGLNTFIQDIRQCPNKESETRRCEKELAKIRNKFDTNKGLSGYHRKKYVWKLLYMYILGYEIDFGHQESSFLVNSNKFSEIYTGYVATSILVNENNSELYKTIAHAIRNDLNGTNQVHQSLALGMIGALAPEELVIQLNKEIQNLAFNENRAPLQVRKKAILCLLRIFRKYKNKFDVSEWVQPTLQMFEQRYLSLGFISSACSFLLGVANLSSPEYFQEIVPKIVQILYKLVIQRECSHDYLYYSTPNPWLQVKLLKILQLYPPPSNTSQITEVLQKIIKKTEVTRMVNKNNADHGILFEAANLIISYGDQISSELRNEVITLAGIFITVRESNIRYLALETLSKFHNTNVADRILKDHLKTILQALRDADVSIRRRALDILYLMCTPQLASKVVDDMLNYVEEADLLFKEELVLKIAILAEKFADDLQWYIEVVIRLMQNGGEYVSQDIWFRIIQIIIGFGGNQSQNQDLQREVTLKLYSALNVIHVPETLVNIGSYILAENAQLLVQGGKEPQKIFDVLFRHFQNSSENTKAMLLNSFAKLGSQFDDLVDQVSEVFLSNQEHFDPDIQQRSVEYLQIFQEDESVRKKVLEKMPSFSEGLFTNNPLLKKLIQLKTQNIKKSTVIDPTLIHQSQKEAEITKEEFMTASQAKFKTSSSDNEIQEYIESLKNHPAFDYCSEKITIEGSNILKKPQSILPEQVVNYTQFKNLLIQPQGIIYQDDRLVIQYKSEFKGHIGQIAMQFEHSQGQMKDISLLIGNDQGLLWNISPIDYKEQFPRIIVQVLCNEPSTQIPFASLFFTVFDSQEKVEFYLPVAPNKFISPIDMPIQAALKFYGEYSSPQATSFYKLDIFIKNPAPIQSPLNEVMKKVGALISTGLQLKANAQPNMQNIQEITATGQFVFKCDKTGNVQNYPIIVQVQCFEEYKQNLRLSLRCAGNGDLIKFLYQVLNMYLGGQ